MLYVRTARDTGKYKRIRNNKSVRIAPCDMRGKIKGEWASAEATLASEDEAQQAYQLLEKKYGLMYKMTRAFLGGKDYVVIAIKV
jgi:PPOX class probable F420-dependent enzyme